MDWSGCGELGRECCPAEQAEGTLCNISQRHKITPQYNKTHEGGGEPLIFPGHSTWTGMNPGGDDKYPKDSPEYAKKPKGVIPGSTGEREWYNGANICGVRDKDCYREGLDQDVTNGILKLDEYYTACGYGDPKGWREGQIRHGNHSSFPGDATWSLITEGLFGNENGECDSPFALWSGFELKETDTCKILSEPGLLNGTTTKNATAGGVGGGGAVVGAGAGMVAYAAGATVLGATSIVAAPVVLTALAIGSEFYSEKYDDDSMGCHYKYRKDWNDRVWDAPPRFKSEADEESVYDPLYIDVDTGIPKARMACCTSYEDGVFKPPTNINGDKIICPLTKDAMDIYSNDDIEKYGAGVYDPGSNVCARYNLNIDGPDTPDKWCSHNITKDNDEFSRGSDGKPVIKVLSDPFWDIKYTKYIKLLTDTSCISWLELDYEQSLTSEQLPFKPRSRALGNELKEFFIWVSANLANSEYTPVSSVKSPNGIRNDLIQVESKMSGFQQGCPSGTVEATQYIGDRSINPENVCNTLHLIPENNQKIISACHSDNPETKAEIDAMLVESGLTCEGVIPYLESDSCTIPSILPTLNKCTDLDSQNCTKSFYSITNGTTITYYPCYQYEKDEQDEWKAKSINGDLIPPREDLSESGCGYYPEVRNVENNN